MPLLTRPTVRVKQISFMGYHVALSDSDLFAAAGAAMAAAKQDKADEQQGKHTLVLKHRRANRPQLKVGFDSIEQRDQWRALLATAAWASPSPITTDKILRPAFLNSYKKLRARAGVSAGYELDGSEAELLADVLAEVLNREVVSDLEGKPDLAKKMAAKVIDRVTVSAVSPVWKALQASLPPIRKPLEAQAAKLLGPVFEQEAAIQAKVRAPMESAAAKALDTAEAKMQELFAKHVPTIAAVAEAELAMLHKALADFAQEASASTTAEDWLSKLSWLERRCSWGWSHPQAPITRLIDAKLVQDSAATRTMGRNLIDQLTYLSQSTCVALRKRVVPDNGAAAAAQSAADLSAALGREYPRLLEQVGSDLVLLLKWQLALALNTAIMPPIESSTGKAIDAACEPITIPEQLQDIVDPARTCEDIITGGRDAAHACARPMSR